MKKIFLLILSVFLLPSVYAGNLTKDTPEGFWKTIDDVTGKPKAIIQIWRDAEQRLYGRILKIYPRPGHDQNELCTACEGEKHNKRIVGMVILNHLQQSHDKLTEWVKGEILDPKNGKTYNCYVELVENGQKLKVRGYIGLPILGRTQNWIRVQNIHKV